MDFERMSFKTYGASGVMWLARCQLSSLRKEFAFDPIATLNEAHAVRILRG